MPSTFSHWNIVLCTTCTKEISKTYCEIRSQVAYMSQQKTFKLGIIIKVAMTQYCDIQQSYVLTL